MTNENDSDEILIQILMDLPEKGAGKPSSRTPGARQTNPQHHLQCRVCSEFWPYGAGKSAGGFNRLRKPTACLRGGTGDEVGRLHPASHPNLRRAKMNGCPIFLLD